MDKREKTNKGKWNYAEVPQAKRVMPDKKPALVASFYTCISRKIHCGARQKTIKNEVN